MASTIDTVSSNDDVDSKLQVHVKTMRDEIFSIDALHSWTVSLLKQRIHEHTTVSSDRQRLIYRGKVLHDQSALSEYHIENGHTLHMVARPENYQQLAQSSSDSTSNTSNSNTGLRQPLTNSTNGIRTEMVSNSASTSDAATTTSNSAESTSNNQQVMEHIRQSMLTMHTLMSTMRSEDIAFPSQNSSQAEICNRSRPLGIAELNSNIEIEESTDMDLNDTRSSSQTMPMQPSHSHGRAFFVGQWVDVKDTVAQWLEATIMAINHAERKMYVHYNGWPERWDEWIDFDSPRVAPFRSRTTHSSMTPYLSPQPNVSVSRAPVTGLNDIRTLLPELAAWMRCVQPLVDEAAALADESLRCNPPENFEQYLTAANRNSGSSISGLAPSSLSSRGVSTAPSQSTEPHIALGMPWAGVGKRRRQTASYYCADNCPNDIYQRRQKQRNQYFSNLKCDGSDESQDVRYSKDCHAKSLPTNNLDSSGLPLLSGSTSDAMVFDASSTREKLGITSPNRSQLVNESECSLYERPPRCLDPTNSWAVRTKSSDKGESLIDTNAADRVVEDDFEETFQSIATMVKSSIGEQKGKDVNITERDIDSEPLEFTEEKNERLRHLSRELCPMLDRLGRIMTDVAPHLWDVSNEGSNESERTAATASSGSSNSFPSASSYLENSILSLLRERPPSPPPERSYRTPILMQTRTGIPGLASRGTTVGALLNDLTGAGFGGNALVRTTTARPTSSSGIPNRSASTGGRQVDIHIAILSPAVSRQLPAPLAATTVNRAAQANSSRSTSGPDRTQQEAMNTLTSSLQAQAQSLAQRTRELSERTTQVSNYTAAIGDALRNLTAATAAARENMQGNENSLGAGTSDPPHVADNTESSNVQPVASTSANVLTDMDSTNPLNHEGDEEEEEAGTNEELLGDLMPTLTFTEDHRSIINAINSSSVSEPDSAAAFDRQEAIESRETDNSGNASDSTQINEENSSGSSVYDRLRRTFAFW